MRRWWRRRRRRCGFRGRRRLRRRRGRRRRGRQYVVQIRQRVGAPGDVHDAAADGSAHCRLGGGHLDVGETRDEQRGGGTHPCTFHLRTLLQLTHQKILTAHRLAARANHQHPARSATDQQICSAMETGLPARLRPPPADVPAHAVDGRLRRNRRRNRGNRSRTPAPWDFSQVTTIHESSY